MGHTRHSEGRLRPARGPKRFVDGLIDGSFGGEESAGASFLRQDGTVCTDVVATPAQKAALERLLPEMVAAQEMAGEKIVAKLTSAPFNNAPIGGLKVVTENGWFAARLSGNEDIYKIYAQSFRGADHLQLIFSEALAIVSAAFENAGS